MRDRVVGVLIAPMVRVRSASMTSCTRRRPRPVVPRSRERTRVGRRPRAGLRPRPRDGRADRGRAGRRPARGLRQGRCSGALDLSVEGGPRAGRGVACRDRDHCGSRSRVLPAWCVRCTPTRCRRSSWSPWWTAMTPIWRGSASRSTPRIRAPLAQSRRARADPAPPGRADPGPPGPAGSAPAGAQHLRGEPGRKHVAIGEAPQLVRRFADTAIEKPRVQRSSNRLRSSTSAPIAIGAAVGDLARSLLVHVPRVLQQVHASPVRPRPGPSPLHRHMGADPHANSQVRASSSRLGSGRQREWKSGAPTRRAETFPRKRRPSGRCRSWLPDARDRQSSGFADPVPPRCRSGAPGARRRRR